MTRLRPLIYALLAVGFAVPGAHAQEPVPSPSLAPFPYQIKVSGNDVVELNGIIRIGIFGDFGKEVDAKLKTDFATTRSNLKLFLDGVFMEGLKPEILPPSVFQHGDPKHLPILVLEYALERNPNDEPNRKAWDTFLARIKLGTQSLEVGVALGNNIPSLTLTKELKFQVRDEWKIVVAILSGLVIFSLLMWWAVATPMLREAGAGTAHSLGKTQMAFWGILVAVSFAGVWVVGHRMERIPPRVLILLGISGTTGLSSVLIGSSKRSASDNAAQELQSDQAETAKQQAALTAERATLEADQQAAGNQWNADQETRLAVVKQTLTSLSASQTQKDNAITQHMLDAKPPKSVGNWFMEIISDTYGISFHRFQVALWTVILGVVFICNVANTFSMPEFDDTLLALLGISNGTYLGFKIPEKR